MLTAQYGDNKDKILFALEDKELFNLVCRCCHRSLYLEQSNGQKRYNHRTSNTCFAQKTFEETKAISLVIKAAKSTKGVGKSIFPEHISSIHAEQLNDFKKEVEKQIGEFERFNKSKLTSEIRKFYFSIDCLFLIRKKPFAIEIVNEDYSIADFYYKSIFLNWKKTPVLHILTEKGYKSKAFELIAQFYDGRFAYIKGDKLVLNMNGEEQEIMNFNDFSEHVISLSISGQKPITLNLYTKGKI